jgi:hypothetical protein
MKGASKKAASLQCPAEKPPPHLLPQCEGESKGKAKFVCFSTFNGSLYRPNDETEEERARFPGSAPQPDTIAVIQKVRPDVLLINEFDYDEDGVSLKHFLSNYLGVAHEGSKCSVVMWMRLMLNILVLSP